MRSNDNYDEEMTVEEMLDYLKETKLYQPNHSFYYEKKMMETDKTIPIKELVERFIDIDKSYNGEPWNIMQILTNIDMIIPVEDR